jgi:hypothetical protein
MLAAPWGRECGPPNTWQGGGGGVQPASLGCDPDQGTSEEVANVLVRALGDLLYTLKAGPAGGSHTTRTGACQSHLACIL